MKRTVSLQKIIYTCKTTSFISRISVLCIIKRPIRRIRILCGCSYLIKFIGLISKLIVYYSTRSARTNITLINNGRKINRCAQINFSRKTFERIGLIYPIFFHFSFGNNIFHKSFVINRNIAFHETVLLRDVFRYTSERQCGCQKERGYGCGQCFFLAICLKCFFILLCPFVYNLIGHYNQYYYNTALNFLSTSCGEKIHKFYVFALYYLFFGCKSVKV